MKCLYLFPIRGSCVKIKHLERCNWFNETDNTYVRRWTLFSMGNCLTFSIHIWSFSFAKTCLNVIFLSLLEHLNQMLSARLKHHSLYLQRSVIDWTFLNRKYQQSFKQWLLGGKKKTSVAFLAFFKIIFWCLCLKKNPAEMFWINQGPIVPSVLILKVVDVNVKPHSVT